MHDRCQPPDSPPAIELHKKSACRRPALATSEGFDRAGQGLPRRAWETGRRTLKMCRNLPTVEMNVDLGGRRSPSHQQPGAMERIEKPRRVRLERFHETFPMPRIRAGAVRVLECLKALQSLRWSSVRRLFHSRGANRPDTCNSAECMTNRPTAKADLHIVSSSARRNFDITLRRIEDSGAAALYECFSTVCDLDGGIIVSRLPMFELIRCRKPASRPEGAVAVREEM